jgi:hypothetical protein
MGTFLRVVRMGPALPDRNGVGIINGIDIVSEPLARVKRRETANARPLKMQETTSD